jgi:hypothetical protein
VKTLEKQEEGAEDKDGSPFVLFQSDPFRCLGESRALRTLCDFHALLAL